MKQRKTCKIDDWLNSGFSRRTFLTGAAASAVFSAQKLAAGKVAIPGEIVKRHDARVERLLAQQVTDSRSPWRGGYPNEFDIYWPHSAARILEAFTAAFLTPASKFYKDHTLAERMRLAAGFLDREQSEQGFITLPSANFNSPPDTGFVVRNVATAAMLARRHRERELEKLTASFLQRAGEGLAVGGVHTPNHRWVVCAAMAQINEVYPRASLVRRIGQWLAESIDISEDGLYSERSTLSYGPTCNNALIVMASKLKRPELLEAVRRNIDAMTYLLHPGNEVVTEISRRQDADSRGGTMSRYWFASRYLAFHDGNGQYAALADLHPEAASLPEVMEYPELLEKGPQRVALPDRVRARVQYHRPDADSARRDQRQSIATQ